ncbi:hypothetical protein GYA19_01020 [Candidatus Beckwithbacteria bacterium]|nr:hypothetical protein [Candidatus Beckwithbacteria bacterium]
MGREENFWKRLDERTWSDRAIDDRFTPRHPITNLLGLLCENLIDKLSEALNFRKNRHKQQDSSEFTLDQWSNIALEEINKRIIFTARSKDPINAVYKAEEKRAGKLYQEAFSETKYRRR